MVVLDKQDFINKVQYLLSQKDTYRLITRDPTIRHKNAHPSTQDYQSTRLTNQHYIQNTLSHRCRSPQFYGLHKIHKQGTPIGPLYPAGVQSLMEWPKSW